VHGLLTRERAEHLHYRVGDDQRGVVGLRLILERYGDDGVGLVAERHGVRHGAPERPEVLRDPVTRRRPVLPRGANAKRSGEITVTTPSTVSASSTGVRLRPHALTRETE
jgi:hypothetical protein